MAVSKRLRYEVLRRDNYTCRYCGAKAPDVEMTVDHVIPSALGGPDEASNLVAACRPCNDGKTSSSPDAPLVAEVAGDALRWAQAVRQAQAAALADLKAREADRRQFAEWWDAWTYEDAGERHTIPRPGDWGQTVDHLVSAGLPLPLLKDCIDRSMGRTRVANSEKFRYMCGVAWKKLAELQDAALAATSGRPAGETPGTHADPCERGRLDFARELLAEVSEEEQAHFLDSSDLSGWQDEDDDPQTEAQLACSAVSHMLNSARCSLDWLVTRVRETLQGLPGDLGERCLAEARDKSSISDPYSRMTQEMSSALYALRDFIDLPAAVAYIDSLAEEERAEWLVFAKALYPHAKLSDERWIARAYNCAKIVGAGKSYYVMCSGTGEHIPDCPTRGTHYARIAGLKCCEERDPGEHKGHLVCEKHLERLIDGTHVSRSGKTLTAVDFTEAKEAVPF